VNKRIAFIDFQKPVRFGHLEPEAPLAFLFLSHSLKAAGYETRLFSFWEGTHDRERFYQDVVAYEPKVLAMNGTFGVFASDLVALLGPIKERLPDAVSIFGGIAATTSPAAYLREPLVDYVCLGEGDSVIVDFCESVSKGQSPVDIPGIYRLDDLSRRPLEAQIVDDLAKVDLDLELIDWTLYATNTDGKIFLRSLQTSRGCPFSCSFCYRSAVRVPYRRFPIERMLTWLGHIKERTRCDFIRIVDDHFFVNEGHAKAVIQEFHQLGVGLEALDLRAETIKHELLSFATANGVRSMFMGSESPVDDILKRMNKRITRTSIDQAIEVIRQYPQITFGTQLMLGTPGMNDDDVSKYVDFAISTTKSTPNLSVNFVVFVPFPGSLFSQEIAKTWPQYAFDTVQSMSQLSTNARFGLEWTSLSAAVKDKVYGIRELFSLYQFASFAGRYAQSEKCSPIWKMPIGLAARTYSALLEWRLRKLKWVSCRMERKLISWLLGRPIGYA
jgi:radical SAM superfamily enzyme YgiQ (UPF0313 family)